MEILLNVLSCLYILAFAASGFLIARLLFPKDRFVKQFAFGLTAGLDSQSLAALRYVINAPARQLFSFKLEGKGLKLLSDASEEYLREHAERSFATLDYWKKVR